MCPGPCCHSDLNRLFTCSPGNWMPPPLASAGLPLPRLNGRAVLPGHGECAGRVRGRKVCSTTGCCCCANAERLLARVSVVYSRELLCPDGAQAATPHNYLLLDAVTVSHLVCSRPHTTRCRRYPGGRLFNLFNLGGGDDTSPSMFEMKVGRSRRGLIDGLLHL